MSESGKDQQKDHAEVPVARPDEGQKISGVQLDLFDPPLPPVVTRLLFPQAMRLFEDHYWSRKSAAKTSRKLRALIVEFWRYRWFDTLGRVDMENLMAHVAKLEYEPGKRYGPSALNKIRMTVSVMFERFTDWVEDGWCGDHDVRGLALPRRNIALLLRAVPEPTQTRYIKPLEMRAYYKIARRKGYHDVADLIRLGIWARLAPIDLFALNDDEIDEAAWIIRVRRRHTKTDQNPLGSLQEIDLTERIWAVIHRQRRFRHPEEKRIFPIRNRRRKLARIRTAAIEQGYPDFTWCHLRKAGPGFLHEEGVDERARADTLGHRDPRVTNRFYTPPGNPRRRKAALMIEKAFS